MPTIRADDPLVPSILDRLIDESPDASRDQPKGYNQVLRELKQSVRRDLQNLLNTRKRCLSLPAEMGELRQSLADYGIPDFSRANFESSTMRQQFETLMTRTIETYEPRFVRVSVQVVDNPDDLDYTLRFKIDALLYAEPNPEPVLFETALEPVTQSFAITRME